MLPVLPGPVLLAETAAPFEMLTDCPAVRTMLPPVPASGAGLTVRLKIPPGVPSLSVPEIEILSIALMAMSPPFPLLLVPLSMCAPWEIDNSLVVIDTFPALPQGPTQASPVVTVVMPPA